MFITSKNKFFTLNLDSVSVTNDELKYDLEKSVSGNHTILTGQLNLIPSRSFSSVHCSRPFYLENLLFFSKFLFLHSPIY